MNFYNLVLNLLVLEKTGSSEQEFNSGLIAGVTTATGIYNKPNAGTSAGNVVQKTDFNKLSFTSSADIESPDSANPKTPKHIATFNSKKKKGKTNKSK